ncbi:MAG: hypothetical protein EP344_04990 [Bacteroidetes bacterium]|nr:MAG: hypothetical protein EP344_04990 [Bacteroidota bacterium]
MRLLLTTLLCTLSLLLYGQSATDIIKTHYHNADKPEPGRKEVLVKIVVTDQVQNKLPGMEVRLVEKAGNQVWHGYTGQYGEVYFLVPRGLDLRVDAGTQQELAFVDTKDKKKDKVYARVVCRAVDFTETVRGDTLFQTVSPAQALQRERILLHLKILDLDNRPLEGEVLYFTAQKSGKVYVAGTDQLGFAYLMLPVGERYCISTQFEANIQCFDIPQSDRAGRLTLTYNTIGTDALLKRQAERARQLAIRDSIFEAWRIRDSIAQAQRDQWYREREERDFLYQMEDGMPMDSVEKRIGRRAGKERDSLARDEKYFEKKGDVVKATLYRMRAAWQRKVIVTDMTCSMSPYIDQVLLWHALQLVRGEQNRYVFFNDGDGKTQAEKIVGKTGGLHFADQVDMEKLLVAMKETVQFGCSGDGPENDLEALLGGAARKSGLDELVLIADNYSDVRDIELLTQLQVPVRIILCGTEHGVNEEYLEVAYKTGGSVHTIEQDIVDLTKLADGATITIGEYQYRVLRGKFIQVSRI